MGCGLFAVGVFAQEKQLLTLTAELGAPSWFGFGFFSVFFPTLPARFHLLRCENYEEKCHVLSYGILPSQGTWEPVPQLAQPRGEGTEGEDTSAGWNSQPWELTSMENPGKSIPERLQIPLALVFPFCAPSKLIASKGSSDVEDKIP